MILMLHVSNPNIYIWLGNMIGLPMSFLDSYIFLKVLDYLCWFGGLWCVVLLVFRSVYIFKNLAGLL